MKAFPPIRDRTDDVKSICRLLASFVKIDPDRVSLSETIFCKREDVKQPDDPGIYFVEPFVYVLLDEKMTPVRYCQEMKQSFDVDAMDAEWTRRTDELCSSFMAWMQGR